jgi:diaminopimelate epimerase
MTMLRFWKGQALGNDYIVLRRGDGPAAAWAADGGADGAPAAGVVRALCDRHRGVGGDGVLLGDLAREPVALRIFNPDGTEAEKSGNGLRIFGAWLHHLGLAGDGPFRVSLPGETVEMEVETASPSGERMVRVDMGAATFRAGDVHYSGAEASSEVLDARLAVGDEAVSVSLVSVGNPHCVVFVDDPVAGPDRDHLARLGPAIQALPTFEEGVNVQLARVVDPRTVAALVWERGAGETLASGSSACAVVAAAVRTGRMPAGRIAVRMPGGTLRVVIDDAWRLRLTGAAQIVHEGAVPAGVVAAWRGAG